MKILLMTVSLFLVGCTAANQDYYQAIENAAKSQESILSARYAALAEIAKNGDLEASTAATMAIALTNSDVIQPRYIESPVLKWAQVLVPSVTALGGMWLQADTAKSAARINRDIQVAGIMANQGIQLGQQEMILGLGEQYNNAVSLSVDGVNQGAFTGISSAQSISDLSAQTIESLFNTNGGTLESVLQNLTTSNTANMESILNSFEQIIQSFPDPLVVPQQVGGF